MKQFGSFSVRIVAKDGTTHHRAHYSEYNKAQEMADDLLFSDAAGVQIYDYDTQTVVYQFPKL